MQPKRRLAAILFTDIVGSTSMMQKDEQIAMSVHKRYTAVLKQSVLSHGGEILNDFGDGSLCSFYSATEALHCAIEMQQQFQQEPKVPLRIGLHIGEIFFESEKVFGDGVNVASRVQSLGITNSILFSSEICSKIKNQQEFKSVSLGRFHFANVDEPMEVFALANEGLIVPQKKQIEGKLHKEKSKGKMLIRITALILLAVIGFFIYRHYLTSNIFTEKERSIAILPFEVTGNNEDILASGLVEDILVHLSKIKEFDKVISNRSSSQYRNTKKNLKEVGEELGAVYIVTGAIQQSANKIRVSAQLIDSRNGNTIWADDYTKENIEIFDLQTELATQIVSALKTHITPEEKIGLSKRYTDNIEAYRLYRKGRSFFYATGRKDSAELYYKKAIELESDYALAYAGLADLHTVDLNPLDAMPIAKAYVRKALSLDSTLSEALTTLGFIQQVFDYDWQGSKKTFEKAIELDPNNFAAHMFYGLVLINSTTNKEKAIKEMKKAVDLNPVIFHTNWLLARNYYFAGKYDLAIKQFKIMVSFDFKDQKYVPFWSLGLIYLKQHLYSKAKEIFDQLPEGNDKSLDNLQLIQSYGYAVIGDKAKARLLLDETYKKYSQPWHWHYRSSQVYVALGNFDQAMNDLEKGYDNRETQMFWINADPAFDPIRNEPRFKALLKKMNFE